MSKSTRRGQTDQFSENDDNGGLLAVVYSRVDANSPEWIHPSLEEQERILCRFIRRNGWQICECIRDTDCGTSSDSPGLQRLGQLLAEHLVDVVVAHSPETFAECQDHAEQLLAQIEQAGASLEFVADEEPKT